MMHFWRETYTRPVRRGPSLAMSIVVHVVLITAAVIATRPPEGLVSTLYEWVNRVIYIAPPVQTPRQPGSEERLKYVDGSPAGAGTGFARDSRPTGQRPSDQVVFAAAGDLGTELKPSTASERFQGPDTVFTIIEVDSAATTDPTSAAPRYPPALLQLGIEGYAHVQYVVDSTGAADPSTLKIISASRVEFAAAVREALPFMRFTPARVGSRKVRQLVEQPFNFRIAKKASDTVAAAARKPPV